MPGYFAIVDRRISVQKTSNMFLGSCVCFLKIALPILPAFFYSAFLKPGFQVRYVTFQVADDVINVVVRSVGNHTV